MTVEIRELIVQVEVTESGLSEEVLPFAEPREWDDQRWVEMIKQEILEQLLERGRL
ncbi:hypothetical protein JFQ86_16420 [Serratia ureilytica]|uniref:DUF5908 family protein n=1 Tax=Serratia ureilytica TaxID=300181 RepID=UPI0018E8D98E|nr:DUF5908 family protein [Serratia ureilytica]MBJ2114415.1 hypothetical protein [Serratia ureilytica]